jgi:sulfoxide reductase catalytic subunit YedY
MLIRRRTLIRPSEITEEGLWKERRRLVKAMGSLIGAAATAPLLGINSALAQQVEKADAASRPKSLTSTPFDVVTHYNNYYEFGWDKTSPSRLAGKLKTDSWTVSIEGLCEKPAQWGLEDLLKRFNPQEFIYRFRCVEGWSAVVPWQGFHLGELLRTAQPLSSARFVRFTSVTQPEAMPMQRDGKLLPWPYVEGLQLNEAMHPLTILATGMYGRELPPQNGAPLRLVVPWKYGFKSIKAIVKIELLDSPPTSSWTLAAPDDYGFYANVNPAVPHPRWSQATERPLGDPFFTPRRKSEIFNGYASEVAALYHGIDLKRQF